MTIRFPVARRAPSRTALRLAVLAFAAGAVAGHGLEVARAQGGAVVLAAVDGEGRPLPDAALWLEPADGRAPPPPAAPREATIVQRDRRFEPAVTVVQAGTPVAFPNEDTVRHHVYSFSPAKTFELKLYIGTPAAPVVFDRAGAVVLGCNIHDRMIAWVQVVDGPWFGRTDESGRARVAAVPAGEYRLRAFHPAQREAVAERRVRVDGAGAIAPVRIELRAGTTRS